VTGWSGRTVALILVGVLLGAALFVVVMVRQSHAADDRCQELGGIRVQTPSSPVCVRRDVVVPGA
jgi:hypothetical protein